MLFNFSSVSWLLGSVWILFIAKDCKLKNCSKIIFKCVNSAVGPIFNESLARKKGLWVSWTVYGTHVQNAGCANAGHLCYPNDHLKYFLDVMWWSLLISSCFDPMNCNWSRSHFIKSHFIFWPAFFVKYNFFWSVYLVISGIFATTLGRESLISNCFF